MRSVLKEYSMSLSVIFGLYIVMALYLNLSVTKQQMTKSFSPSLLDFLSLFKVYYIEQVLIFLFSFFLLKKCILLVSNKSFAEWKEWLSIIIPAAMFSSFMVAGFSFKTTGNASCITFSYYQFFKSVFVGGGYFILFFCLIILLFERLDNLSLFSVEPVSVDSSLSYFYRHPFIVSYFILFVCSLPYIVISYPGIFMGDTWQQIFQGYNLHSNHPYVLLISEKVALNNHHPVIHTLLLHYFIILGKFVRSYNFGAFLFSFFQLNLFISVISFSIKVLIERYHLKMKYVLVILLYFLIHPFVQNYMMLISKDILFSIFFLQFLFFGCLFLEQEALSLKNYVTWIIMMLGIVLFRNEGFYLIIPTLLFLLLLNISKKKVGLALVIIVCYFLTWHHVVFPFFKITPGGIQEMLSIPFQQTARYVKYRSQKVTKDEMRAIDAVLDYKGLIKNYNPNLSDPVKATFKQRSTKEQRLRYLKTWAKMFFKEPKLYIEATIANKWMFFYPKIDLHAGIYDYGWSDRCMQTTNKNKNISFDFHHIKKFEKYRIWYEQLRIAVFNLPIINVLCFASTYICSLFLLMFYIFKQGNKKALALLVPSIVYFMVLMAGPCNGTYFRYLYPYIVTFPFLFVFVMRLKKENKA